MKIHHAKIPHAKGVSLTEDKRKQLRTRIEREGEAAVVESLGIARMTMARCLAGLPVQRATEECVTRRLTESAAHTHIAQADRYIEAHPTAQRDLKPDTDEPVDDVDAVLAEVGPVRTKSRARRVRLMGDQ